MMIGAKHENMFTARDMENMAYLLIDDWPSPKLGSALDWPEIARQLR
jgi:hypothetical protein